MNERELNSHPDTKEDMKAKEQSSKKVGTTVKRKKETKRKKSKKGSIVIAVLILIFGTASAILLQDVMGVGSRALMEGYSEAFETEREEVYHRWYQKYYDKTEQEYHVRNRGSISIGNIAETGKLEVLRVSDVEYVISDRDKTNGNVISWLEVPGEGVFVVDLQEAEFVIDDERAHVLVRIPSPELTHVTIDYKNVNKLLFKDDGITISNGNYKQGEEIADRLFGEGLLLIKKEFASNQVFYLTAKDAAVSTISCLIRQLNPDEPDLVIEVEFF